MRGPIQTINAVLGDESFVARFGRIPTTDDDPTLRVATHLGHVAHRLRERGKAGPVLDALDAYVAAGAFPKSEAPWGLLPSFVDPTSGVRCAVAHLVEHTAGPELVEALDRDHHNGYISTFAEDSRFLAWATTTELTLEELAWIQPAYVHHPQVDDDFRVAVAAEVATARGRDDAMPAGFALAHASIELAQDREGSFYNAPIVRLDGALGATTGAREPAFAFHVHAGQELRFWGHSDSGFIAGWTVGVGLDRYGDALRAAWTAPVEGYWNVVLTEHVIAGIHGGFTFAPGGLGLADRTWFAGTAGFGVKYRGIAQRFDVTLSADASRIDETTFLGLTLGVAGGRMRPAVYY